MEMTNGNSLVLKNKDYLNQEEVCPSRRSLCSILMTDPNIKCLILTIIIYCSSIFALWYCGYQKVTKIIIDFNSFPITNSRVISPCEEKEAYFYFPFFILILYLLYIVECWHSKIRFQLSVSNKMDHNTLYRYIDDMKSSKAEIFWKASLYHYNRRTRQATRYKNGNAFISTEVNNYISKVYYEKVCTREIHGTFFYSYLGQRDISRGLNGLEKFNICRIKFSKCFVFANNLACNEFQDQRKRFFQIQKQNDQIMEIREGLDFPNIHFKESLVSWLNTSKPPWYGSITIFWLLSFFLLSWPLRIFIELQTAHINYSITKLFGENYGSSGDYQRNIRRFFPSLAADQESDLFSEIERERIRSESRAEGEERNEEDQNQNHNSNDDEDEEGKPFLPSGFYKGRADHINREDYYSRAPIPRSITLLISRPKYHYVSSAEKNFASSFSDTEENFTLVPSYSEAMLLYNNQKQDLSGLPSSSVENRERDRDRSDGGCGESEAAQVNYSRERGEQNSHPDANLLNRVLSQSISEFCIDLTQNIVVSLAPPQSSSVLDTREGDNPPSYIEALRSSRPLFLPALVKLRRCLTEKNIAGTYGGRNGKSWLNNVHPTFLQNFNSNNNKNNEGHFTNNTCEKMPFFSSKSNNNNNNPHSSSSSMPIAGDEESCVVFYNNNTSELGDDPTCEINCISTSEEVAYGGRGEASNSNSHSVPLSSLPSQSSSSSNVVICDSYSNISASNSNSNPDPNKTSTSSTQTHNQ